MHSVKSIRFPVLILYSLLLATTLSAQAKKGDSKKAKTYTDIITKDAVSDEGLFTTHKVKSKWYFEIPDSLLEREILVVSRISGTISGFNFGGAGMKARGQQVWRWQKMDDQLLLRYVSYNSVATEDKPIYESVRNNNFEPIIMTFKIETENKTKKTYVVDVGPLFSTDVKMIGPLSDNQRKNFKIKSLDKKRSMITRMKSFPMNTEVRHILTWSASALPSNNNTGTLSIEMNQSMILLPKVPMMPRLYDRRVGFFSINQIDYGRDAQKAESRRYITRWRLEPKDMAAFKRGELVEPKKPIVYYIDPATPMKWRKYLKQGVDDWNVAFEKAGFKNAIMAKDPPSKEEDPDWSPEDVRYSVIRYTANPIQNAMGPHVHDPRSGEIIESDIIWYHNVMNLLRNWFFVQTAAVNPDARSVKFKDEVMGELIRFVSAHEVGHTLGFPHNMGSSFAHPVDSMRDAGFTRRNGVSPSIMDYARFNYIAQPGDNAFLYPKIGIYDKWVTEWGYKPIPDASTPDEEQKTLNAWVRSHEGNPYYWYGAQVGNPHDPRAQTEDLSDDAMKASTYGVMNLKRILDNLVTWTKENGKTYDDLNELYGQVLNQWNRYNRHVRTHIGGIYETHKTYDQAGTVYDVVPLAKQKRAMDWLHENVFQTPNWILKKDILNRIDNGRSVDRVRAFQVSTLNQLLTVDRMARLIETKERFGSKAYSLTGMMRDLRDGIFAEFKSERAIDTYRRNLQRAYVDRLSFLMTDAKSTQAGTGWRKQAPAHISQSDIRAVVRAELKMIMEMADNADFDDKMSQLHADDLEARIEMILGDDD